MMFLNNGCQGTFSWSGIWIRTEHVHIVQCIFTKRYLFCGHTFSYDSASGINTMLLCFPLPHTFWISSSASKSYKIHCTFSRVRVACKFLSSIIIWFTSKAERLFRESEECNDIRFNLCFSLFYLILFGIMKLQFLFSIFVGLFYTETGAENSLSDQSPLKWDKK